ncbi:MAG: response regulator [Chthoniobacteraceae bacterium]|jgi:DNA-binding response OmpR family regulator|nr:response regulator [Chthoniobacteraceae bacterium]
MARILLIEDDNHLRPLLFGMLQAAGHEVAQASNGKEGLAAFNEWEPEIVITDLMMPEKDGLEIIMELRRKNPKLQIIAMSGGIELTKLNLLPVAQKLGAVRTLAKPFRPRQLLEAVSEALEMASKN